MMRKQYVLFLGLLGLLSWSFAACGQKSEKDDAGSGDGNSDGGIICKDDRDCQDSEICTADETCKFDSNPHPERNKISGSFNVFVKQGDSIGGSLSSMLFGRSFFTDIQRVDSKTGDTQFLYLTFKLKITDLFWKYVNFRLPYASPLNQPISVGTDANKISGSIEQIEFNSNGGIVHCGTLAEFSSGQVTLTAFGTADDSQVTGQFSIQLNAFKTDQPCQFHVPVQ
jgi:hypothetical protein